MLKAQRRETVTPVIKILDFPMRESLPGFLNFGQTDPFAFSFKNENGVLVPDVVGGVWEGAELENLRLWATHPSVLARFEAFNLGRKHIPDFMVVVDPVEGHFSLMLKKIALSFVRNEYPSLRVCRRRGPRGKHSRLIDAYRLRVKLIAHLSTCH